MSGDYSRERFDASADVSGVRMQQGRVQLDADWNEWVDVVGRRFRAETVDLVGREPDPDHQGVAVYPRQTPDAFRISLAGGDITIGRGRMYVDGLLTENHGAGDLEFDHVLEEVRGADGLAYDAQPYFPTPPHSPRPAAPSPTSTSGSARSPTSRIPGSSRAPSASTRRPASRPCGRSGCCRTWAPTSPAPRPTRRSRAGPRSSGPRRDA